MSKPLGFNVELPLSFDAALEGAPELASVARDARERMVRVTDDLAGRDGFATGRALSDRR